MKTSTRIRLILAFAVGLLFATFFSNTSQAQLVPGPDHNRQLNQWPFSDTNWLSTAGYGPVSFTNIQNEPDGNQNCLWLDTSGSTPAFLLYNVVETNGFTNIICQNGSISVWFSPDWSSTNQGGTGPGDWANLISLGQAGTNGSSWWAWYFSPDGCTVYFSSQTNGSASSNYLAAPVSLTGGNWYNLVLTYSQTNSAFYTNGVLVTNGTGVTYWPGPDATFFAVGSDTNGYYQSEAELDDLQTYNYPLGSNMVAGLYGMYSFFYGLTGSGGGAPQSLVTSAPWTNTVVPTFDAVTGPGFLSSLGTSAIYPASSNVWLTNWSTTTISSNVMNLDFAVAGGSNGVPYDVFATAALLYPITNSTWYWMGQAYRGTNYALPMTNFPPGNIFLILGTPQDTDQDGLTDAYERLISHTNPNNPTSANDGILDGWKVVWGLPFGVDPTTQPNLISTYTYDPASRLKTVAGVRTETIAFDPESNIQTDSQ